MLILFDEEVGVGNFSRGFGRAHDKLHPLLGPDSVHQEPKLAHVFVDDKPAKHPA